jgi:hypothetical protein
MSLKEREEAKEIIKKALIEMFGYYYSEFDYPSDYILNQLLKAGYLNDKVTVQADDVFDQLEQAVFKCKVEE